MSTTGEEQLAEVLVQCCSLGDPHTLQQVVREYPDLDYNMATEGGVTLLMHTVIGAGTSINPDGLYVETCQVLIQQCGVALETPDVENGRTAAHWAIYYHRHDILTELIIAGADMTCPDFSGNSPFHLSIQESATECLYQALRFLPKQILEIPDSQSRLPLSLAIQVGNTDAIQMLVEAGAGLDSVDESTGRTPLHYAVELGELGAAVVEFLIKSGAPLDIQDSAGLTPIHLAGIVESKEPMAAIAKVVGGGEVLDLPNTQGLTPLMYACAYGNEETVKFLVKKKASLLAQDLAEGKLCIHYAAESGHPATPDIVQFLCKKQSDLLEAKDGYGRTPLHSCARAGSVETLQVLVALNCSLSTTDSDGRNAVYWAAVSGNHTVLASLLEAGCRADLPDVHGTYPLHYAVQQTKEPLPTDVDEFTEEGLAHCQNVQQCVTVLLDGGMSIDCRDAQGLTPLHWALQLPNNLAVCFKLLEHGADPNAKDSDQMSALHIAARRGLTENCQFLLEHTSSGHYGNETDVHGQTALHHAVSCDGVECVDYLLSCGLSANQPDEELRTPAHLAATVGSVQCLQTLQAYGANFSLKSKYGATPLHEAAANGNADSLEFIVSVSGEEGHVNEPAEGGATALHYAVSGGQEDCVRVLLQFGANINSVTMTEEGSSLTPLDYCSEENADLADLLRTFGALSGEAVTEQMKAAAAVMGSEPSTSPGIDQQSTKDDGEVAAEEKSPHISLPGTRPSSRISVESPKFEAEPVATPTDGATTPKRPELPLPDAREPKRAGLLERALSILRRSKSPAPPESIFSSAIGFYAAHATMLAAAIIGTPLGEKTMEIAQKVATDTAEELKKSAAALDGEIPDLIWLQEKIETPRTPSPVVVKVATPPPPPTPPAPEVKEDPYDRRLRKARAQMDMSKSAAFLAVEELIKAQETHMRLKRQFQEAKLEEDIKTRKEVFHAEEAVAREASEKVMKRFAERMNKAETESKKVNNVIEKRLKAAHEENAKLTHLMSSLGINPRPTVAEWIRQKDNQKKTTVQEALIDWDRGKQARETAILLQQTITSQRAMKHAAWDARKDITSKLKALKDNPVPPNGQQQQQQQRSRQTRLRNTYKQRVKVPAAPERNKATGKLMSPAAYRKQQRMRNASKEMTQRSRPTKGRIVTKGVPDTVRATPSGFFNMRDTPTHDKDSHDDTSFSERRRLQQHEEEMWQMGQRYIDGEFVPYKRSYPPSEGYLRATGSKSVHAERTLFFYHPEQYKTVKATQRALEKQLNLQLGLSPTRSSLDQRRRGNSASSITIRSLDFTSKKVSTEGQRLSLSGQGTQFHSLADSVGKRPKRSKSTPGMPVEVLPMTILDPTQIPTAVAT